MRNLPHEICYADHTPGSCFTEARKNDGGAVASPQVVNAFLGQNKNLGAQIDALMVPSRGICCTHGISNWFLHTRLVFDRKLEFVVFSSSRRNTSLVCCLRSKYHRGDLSPLLGGWMGCFSRRCECISWAKKELSSSEERPNVALKGHMAHSRNFKLVATHQARVQPKTGFRRFFLVSVKHKPGVWSV